jgi:hypothetical protein
LDEQEKLKIKNQKVRIRRARNAQRKLKKARTELEALGEITDWEDEFIASVDERLEKFDSAFADPSLGGFGEALSNKQKQVLAQMRRKIKDKSKQAPQEDPGKLQWKSSFKNKSNFKPRVRNIEDEMFEDEPEPELKLKTSSPKHKPFLKIIDGGKK